MSELSQLQQVREFAENFWTIFADPRDGQQKKYIEQGDLLALLDEL